MIEYAYITGPLIGGVIGYITNALAIRMLFRPYKAKYVFGVKIPFTPGIIPKEKGRIAASIGAAISQNLMSHEVLHKNLLSDEMIGKLRAAITDFFERQKHNSETVHDFLLHYLSDDEILTATDNIKGELTSQISTRLADSRLGTQIADVVVEHVTSKLRIDGLELKGLNMGKLLGANLWGALADMVSEPIKRFLARSINKMLTDRGPEIVNNLLTAEIGNFSALTVEQLLQGHDDDIQQLTDTIVSLYKRLISERLPRILATVDIPKIIESRINEMDMAQTERLIFEVMDKELKAIIWLGAGLGFIMGFVNAI